MGRKGKGVEYAGRIPGTKVGSFGAGSVSKAMLPRLKLVPRPTVEKLGRYADRRRGAGTVEDGEPLLGDSLNTSAGLGRGGRAILLGVEDIVRDG